MEDQKAHVKSLIHQAATADKSMDALHFSQAALNAANAIITLQTNKK